MLRTYHTTKAMDESDPLTTSQGNELATILKNLLRSSIPRRLSGVLREK